jgi:hypothetical protein
MKALLSGGDTKDNVSFGSKREWGENKRKRGTKGSEAVNSPFD